MKSEPKYRLPVPMVRLQPMDRAWVASLYRVLWSLQIAGWSLSFLLFSPVAGQAPQKKKVSLQVSATVLHPSPVEIFTLRSISLQRAAGDGGSFYIDPAASPDAGLLLIRGTAGSRARISYPRVLEARMKGEAEVIRITCEMALSPVQIQYAARVIEREELLITFNRDGHYYLWIGGVVHLGRARPGNYVGVLTIEIDYL